jgi:MFS family permease
MLRPGRQLRRARAGVTVTFAVAGALVGVFTARIPALVDKLSMTTMQLGALLFVWGLGAVVTMQVLRPVMSRVGSACVLRVAAPLYAVSVALVASAPTFGLAMLEVAMFGVAFGAVEVSAKAQGSAVERAYGRPLLGGMHAGWPVGAGVGGLSAALCAHLAVSYTTCLGGAAVLALPLTVALGRTLLDAAPAAPSVQGRSRGRVRPVVYLFGVVAFAALVLEGAVTDWTGVLLHDGLGSSQAVAALAYPVFQAGMLTGRLAADRARSRVGDRNLVIGAGLATTAGFLAATAMAQPLVVLAGVYGVGVAISPLLPLAVSLAGATDSQHGEAAIAQLSVIGYAGLLAGPAMIGALADLVVLRVALAVVAVALGSVIVMAGQLLPEPDARVAETPPYVSGSRPQESPPAIHSPRESGGVSWQP